ncbi:MAG: VWA domain-containing protein, partial [Verrucomicrobiales bacterium]|nr:VWA domain-containing protein [Verrucomicrobiales bacterium]
RRRVEQWLLLLLRCLLLVLLALIFARPWWRGAETRGAAGAGVARMVLVDVSASMQRPGLWEEALRAGREAVRGLTGDDGVALASFDTRLKVVLGFPASANEMAVQAAERAGRWEAGLKELRPGMAATDLGAALTAALDEMAALPAEGEWRRELVVITDLQEGCKLDALSGVAWPEAVTVRVVKLEAPVLNNLTLAAAPMSGQRGLRLRVTADGEGGAFELAWTGGDGLKTLGSVEPRGRAVVQAPPRAEADETKAGELRLVGDEWALDNAWWLAAQSAVPLPVRVDARAGSADKPGEPAFYLRRALLPTAVFEPEFWWASEGGPEGRKAEAALWIYAGDGQRLTEAACEEWRAAMEAGALGVYVADDAASAAELRRLAPDFQWRVEEWPAVAEYRLLGGLETGHPLMQAFADPRLRDFSRVRFWRGKKVSIEGDGVQTLARWEDGSPSWQTVPVGTGRLIVMESGWHPQASQLGLSSKFVPLWFGWLEAAGWAQAREPVRHVGDTLGWREGARPLALTGPDGAVMRGEDLTVMRAMLPGIYTLEEEGAGRRTKRQVAVQMDPAEGRLQPLDLEVLTKQWGLPVAGEEASEAGSRPDIVPGAEVETRQQGWWWLLLVALAVSLMETWVANRRMNAPPTGPAPA